MAKNPEVTVRMRGVMEKCTFCTQRIEAAKIARKVEGWRQRRRAGHGCRRSQDRVPTGLPGRGDRLWQPARGPAAGSTSGSEEPRDYTVLGFLDTRPRITYLAKIRNPNPKMPDYQRSPFEHRRSISRCTMAIRSPKGATAPPHDTAGKQPTAAPCPARGRPLMATPLQKFRPYVVAPPPELEREPLVLNQRPFGWISDKIAGIAEGKTPTWWWIAWHQRGGMLTMFTMVAYLISTGVGVWGLHQPAAWAWDITNFVFWIGIGHAGTLISAILCLLRQRWRTSINRAAEAMTLFAVVCAGIFPVVHTGRVWFA
jgi:hypothetical protein